MLLGLAIGDALGAAVEFRRPGTFAPVTGYRAGGPHGLDPGEWTDDTSMALALADSLAARGMDPIDQSQRYVAWWRDGAYSVTGACFDIGNATRAALARFVQTGELGGDTADGSSGNGSIMRLAPVPIHFASLWPNDVAALAEQGAVSSRTTHASAKCLSACRWMTVALAALAAGTPREEVLATDFGLSLHPEIAKVVAGSYRGQPADAIRGSGYVVRSLEAALWAFHDAASFQDAVLAAVNLGDDADTTGAICGQLAGAFFGVDGIPPGWLAGLARSAWIEDAVARLGKPPTNAVEPAYVI